MFDSESIDDLLAAECGFDRNQCSQVASYARQNIGRLVETVARL
jgi:hypothetical protein